MRTIWENPRARSSRRDVGHPEHSVAAAAAGEYVAHFPRNISPDNRSSHRSRARSRRSHRACVGGLTRTLPLPLQTCPQRDASQVLSDRPGPGYRPTPPICLRSSSKNRHPPQDSGVAESQTARGTGKGQRSIGGTRRREEAMETEGEWPGETGEHQSPSLARWGRGPRPTRPEILRVHSSQEGQEFRSQSSSVNKVLPG